MACLTSSRLFAKAKSSAMADDVEKLRFLSDPLTHTRLIRFCHNTRFSYFNQNLTHDVMKNQTCGLLTKRLKWR